MYGEGERCHADVNDRRTSKVDATLAGVAHVTRLKLINNRVMANPLEPRAIIALHDAATDTYELTVSSQGVLYFLRGLCEHTLRASPDKMHIRTYDVGGAFGTKELPYPKDVAILYAARILGRPIKWTVSLPKIASGSDSHCTVASSCPTIRCHCRYSHLGRAPPPMRPDMIFGKDKLNCFSFVRYG